jgi:hypothetical protein
MSCLPLDEACQLRGLSSLTSGEELLHELKNHEATGIPKDAGTDSPAGFDLVCIARHDASVNANMIKQLNHAMAPTSNSNLP